MKPKPKIPVSWSQADLTFIRDNYYQLTWTELFAAVSQLNKKATMQALRHQCVRMKLAKQVQIRWSKEDTQYLIDNYKIKGDKELAIDLNKFKRTFRIIKGEKIYRIFSKKHIEKKMKLLGLRRTHDEHLYIRRRNIQTGLTYAWNKTNNPYSLGFKTIAAEGTIRVWSKFYPSKRIKINGQFISYARYIYEQNYGSIPEGYNVWFKDKNPLNCEPDNLYLVSRQDQTVERIIRNYPEELKELLKLNYKLNRQISKSINK